MGAGQPHPVDEGAVGAPQVLDHHHPALSRYAGVLPRHLRVGDLDIVAGVSSQSEPVPIQYEALTGLRALAHHQPGITVHVMIPPRQFRVSLLAGVSGEAQFAFAGSQYMIVVPDCQTRRLWYTYAVWRKRPITNN